MAEAPGLLDVFAARKRIAPYVMRTPLHHYPGLDRLIGTKVFVKHENHHLLGAFKIRGALNVISQLSEGEKARGVVCASTGNFGQGIAYAASVLGARATVFVPKGANPDKCAAMREFGADLVHHGANFDEARTECERRAEADGSLYIHSADEPRLIPGVATYALEIFEDLPDVDVILVPVGAGSGACGTCIVANAINPRVRVIGVQSEAAPAAFLSWKTGDIVSADMGTVAEGLATSVGFELTQRIMRDLLDDFLLVSDAELDRAVGLYLETTHNLAEHAGAAPLAAAIGNAESLKGQQVVLVLSGGNISQDHLRKALA